MMMIWEISWCRNGWPPSLRCLFRFHLRGSTSNPSAKRNIVGLPKETVLTIRESSSIAKKGSTSNASTERNHSIISAVPKKIPLRRERLVAGGSYARIPLLK
ncbi:uncharacterized protein LOC124893197 isoform X3 [Capsicum annuum]|uniref:uncharacterized protein LOC124893197 isoform X3 n=1 Tax=Capsicum annuum TaxID=4072 RepID=UPI001FB19947|nr:uncharacterized protein LOC124893197 isoform X3 [Capsicum annuum]